MKKAKSHAITSSLLSVIAFSLFFLLLSNTVLSQTYDLRLVRVSNNGSTLVMKVQASFSSAENLGSSNLVFTYDGAEANTPVLGTIHNFSGGSYSTMTLTSPATNTVSLNIEYTGADGGGTAVPTGGSFIDVAEVSFTIPNETGTANFQWQESTTTKTVVYQDDNSTFLSSGTLSNNNLSLDATAPTLINQALAQTDFNDLQITYQSNETGTLYYVVTTNSSTPTQAQILAGNDQSGNSSNVVSSGNSAVTVTGSNQTIALNGLTLSSTTYHLFIYEEDAAGNQSSVVTNSAAVDATAPTLTNQALAQTDFNDLQITYQSNETGTLYYVVTTNSSTPTQAQVLAGNDQSGNSSNVVSSGNSAVTVTGSNQTIALNGLTLSSTTYHLFIYEEDAAGNQSSVVTNSAAVDATAPSFENSTPNAASISTTTFTLNTDIDEAGTIFYVVLADGATAPTSTEVVNGTGNGGAAAVTSANVSVTTGGFTNAFSVTGLTAGTGYDVYVVARDQVSNLQTSPILVNVSTSVVPSFSVNDPSVSEGDAGSTTLTFTVTLDSGAPAGGATVDFATSDGTATAGSDYTSATGTVSFSVGETSKTIDVTISGDELVEVDETITMTLSNPTGTSVVIGDATGTGTITNEDSATVTIANVAVNENDGTATITLTLDNAVDGGFDVDVSTADNTATTADSDYAAVTSATETFAGTASETETFTITLGGDTKVEADELVDIAMSNLVPTTVDASDIDITDAAQLTITNDDSANVTIANVAVNENDGTATITLTLDNAVDGGFDVDVSTADNTATTADGDYTAVTSATETFAGTASETETFTITIGGDTKVEADELVDIAMSNLVPTTVDASDIDITDAAQLTLTNDDAATVTIANVAVNENDGTATITLTLDNAVDGGFDVDVSTADNTATTADGDYTAVTSATETFAGTASETETFTITIGGDTKVEADELVDIAMSNLVPTTVDAGDIDITDAAQLTLTNDDAATVTIANVAVNENDGTATITLTLDNAVDGGFDVDVSTADGTATTADGDYTAVTSATETFAGTASETETFTVTLGGDTKVEADEFITISMSGLSPATVAGGDIDITDGATLTLTNDDNATVTIANVSGNEDDGAITVTVTLDNAVDGGFDVDVSTADGTATTADSDYIAVTNQTLTFAGTAGETETFTVTPTADVNSESNETVSISMSNKSPASVASANIDITDGATVTIINDDDISASINDPSIAEGDAGSTTLTFTVSLDSPAPSGGATVDYATSDGTASSASDYTSTTGTVSFSVGETSKTIDVTISGDELVEVDETITMTLSNPTGTSVVIGDATGTGTITNEDSA
ncbi:beta strand repeat-containing protein, partial [Roseivirga misakiensis]|uniref:beta strand repeat-containing protein n=1 Tax=Roseivirga misakiensis TaxID=1563681 RepID=UPI000AA9C873